MHAASQWVPHAGQAPAGSRDAIFELDDRLLGYAARCLVGGSGRTADAPGALPRPPTSLWGGEHELADARRMLARSRLLTLTEPGGCGKTRLSIELAAGVADEYPDGVHFPGRDHRSGAGTAIRQVARA